jgi:hypothetical protein
MKYALKVTGGLNPELTEGKFAIPDAIIMAMEEKFGTEQEMEHFLDEEEINRLIPRAVKCITGDMLGSKWLPKGADKVMEASRKDLIALAVERGYPLSIEERLAACVWNAQRLRELEGWKTEQKKIRRANQHFAKKETTKKVGPLGKKWDDAQVYELPPLVQSDGKSMKHENARYCLRLPDGKYYDLGMTQDLHRPILSDGPDIALQRIAKRAGLDIRGGAHTIIQALTGLTDIIPSYMTIWQRNQWVVIVGWQKDPKLTKSSYYIDGHQLSMIGQEEDQLTLSELDYHLLKGAAETEVQDEQGEVVDYMNEEEELVAMAFDREEDRSDWIDVEQFEEGSIEEKLIMFSQRQHNPSVSLIGFSKRKAIIRTISVGQSEQASMGDIHSQNTYKALKEEYAYAQKLHQNAMRAGDPESASKHLERMKTVMKMAALRDEWMNPGFAGIVQYWMPIHKRGFGSVKGTENHPPALEPVRTRPEMALAPANEIEVKTNVIEVNEMPPHKTWVMNRVKRGTLALVETNQGLVTKRIDKIQPAPLSARNASPTLKAKLRSIIREELETGTLHQEVSDTFAMALESALRGLR